MKTAGSWLQMFLVSCTSVKDNCQFPFFLFGVNLIFSIFWKSKQTNDDVGTNKRSEKSRLQSSNNSYTEGFEVKRRFIFKKQITSCFNLNFRYLEAFFWTQKTAAGVKTLKTLTKISLNYNKWWYIKLSSFKKWSLVFYYIFCLT